MKSLTLLLVLCFVNQVNAQEFLPVLSADKVWTQSSCNLPYIFRIRATAITNNEGYTEMEYSETETGDEWETSEYYLKEEGPKLYMNNGEVERLVYDMSVSIGDTILSWSEFTNLTDDINNVMIVSEIDSVTYADNVTRKRISFMYPSGFPIWQGYDWIEGIGPINGLSDPFGINIADCASLITCMEEDEELVYNFDINRGCWYFITSTNEVKSSSLSISPNPAGTHLTVKVNESKNGILSIYDQFGNLYYIRNIKEGQFSAYINLLDWNPGMYFVNFTYSNGKISTEKLIITK